MTLESREYQERAVGDLSALLRQGLLRLMLRSPTGSGKTEMSFMMILRALNRGKRVAFICDRITLIEQTSKRLYAMGIEHGIIQGNNTFRAYEKVIVCSIQTLAKRELPEVDLIIIDEANSVAGSKSYRDLIIKNKTKTIIGLDAAPYAKGLAKHYDALGGPLFQEMVIAATIDELTDKGFLVGWEGYAPSKPDLEKIRIVANEYHKGDASREANKPKLIGDIVNHWIKLAYGTPTVCFANDIAHSKSIVKEFLLNNIPAEHIDHRTKPEERAAMFARVESGETLILSCAMCLGKGWNMPIIKTMILARLTRSLSMLIQMLGRCLRASPGKQIATVLDHSGALESISIEEEDLPKVLDDGRPNKSSKKKDKEKPLPKACPKCFFLRHEAGKCPKCGFQVERQSKVVVAEGELRKIERKNKPKKKEYTHEDKQRFYSELVHIQKDRGYSQGWCAHQYKGRFGVWPKNMDCIPCAPSLDTINFVKSRMIAHAKRKRY